MDQRRTQPQRTHRRRRLALVPQGSVASGVLVDGARIQFADLNNDGRADYLDVNPQNGATRAWINYG